MNLINRHILGIAFGAALCGVAPNAFAQATSDAPVQLSVENMRRAAELNLHNGQMERALAFADALLQRDAGDVTALLIRSHALREMTRFGDSQVAARSAWRLAENDNQKFAAATLMAQALSSEEKRTRAQTWLRRAHEVAPTPQHEALATRHFKHVQQRNPWQTNISFTLAPNSNINNGSARETSTLLTEIFSPLFGPDAEAALGASSQALSGIEAGFNLQSRYRFHQTELRAHDLRFGLSYRTYALSNSSKNDLAAEDAELVARGDPARDVSASDFSFGTVQIGYGFKQLREDRRGEFTATADIGQTFFAGARLNSFLRARVGQSYFASPTTKFDFGASADLRTAQRGGDNNLYGLNTGMSRQLANGNGLFLGASLNTVTSELERLEYDEIRLSSGYVLAREVMGTALHFGINTSFRDYDISPHSPDGRQEFEIGAQVTATFKQIDYLGFNPTLSVQTSRTNSNIGLFDVNRLAVSVGIASAF